MKGVTDLEINGSRACARGVIFVVAATASLVCCLADGRAKTLDTIREHGEMKKAVVTKPQFHQNLLKIAAEYQNYGKVDDMARWAPWLCSAPLPPKARLSASTDGGTHGRKVYYLFAKNRDAYMKKQPSPVGQVVVKESWLPNLDSASNAVAGGAKPTEKRDLFIMYKLDSKVPDTDQGWVYGTATADGQTITSAGRVESCMSCHIQTANDRLFGLKPD